MELRVVALSAPEFPEGTLGSATLTSTDPASLFNACRYGAKLATTGSGSWGHSNWATTRANRRDTVLLAHSLREDLPIFEKLLCQVRPTLLLIGAMTVCLPGAVACARRAKEILGDQVCVVLGGHHATETMYSISRSLTITHHPGSPLRLMAEGLISPVFDFVISGESEHIIGALGEAIAIDLGPSLYPARLLKHAAQMQKAPGQWILGAFVDGKIVTLQSRGGPLDHNLLPAPCAMFGVRSAFDIFKGRLTAHVFSDSGRGCVYDCDFCSERRSVNGIPAQLGTAAARLFNQLLVAVDTITADSPGFGASAFVEDSTLLGGSNTALAAIADLLGEANLDLVFGCQFTIDQILNKSSLLRHLKSVGLEYVFIGIETLDPLMIGGMSKDLKMGKSWRCRTEMAIEILAEHGISCGAALLFGLGETRAQRKELFNCIDQWQRRYGLPRPISMNWAVQHPLKGLDGGTGYRYHQWGTPPGDYLEAFRGFGEASLLYPLAGQTAPTLEEVIETQQAFAALSRDTDSDLLRRRFAV